MKINSRIIKSYIFLFSILVLLSGCQQKKASQNQTPYLIMLSMDGFRWDYTDMHDTPNFDRVAKKGVKAASGNNIKVHYTGYFKNGKKFDSSVDRGNPLEFELGIGRVIKGWDIGMAQLRTGEKARLIIGAPLAYGSKGNRSIPPNAKLIFDVELIEVN